MEYSAYKWNSVFGGQIKKTDDNKWIGKISIGKYDLNEYKLLHGESDSRTQIMNKVQDEYIRYHYS